MENTQQALFIILNDLHHLDDILENLVELGVKGATILDSEGMATHLMKEDPGLRYLFKMPLSESVRLESTSKTIFTVVKNIEKVNEIVESIRHILEAENSEGPVGFMFSVPVSGIYLLQHKNN